MTRRRPVLADPVVPPALAAARAAYTEALQSWIRSRGDDEPAARERLTRARIHLTNINEGDQQ